MKNSATRCKHAAWQILHSSFLILHFHKESENNYCRCRRSRHTLGQLLSREKQDIILMDDNEDKLSTLNSNFDLMTATAPLPP